MDAFQEKLIDANKVRKIFTNTHDRLRKLRKKTDEDYLKILIDEINDYFACLESSAMCSTDLADPAEGPDSTKHNSLIQNATNDIDLIHAKRKIAEEMLTKSVNYMSQERTSVAEAASKLQSRVTARKLRSSVNNRNMLVFSEYFNDDGLSDIKASKNTRIDKARSALSLAAVTESTDNSKLIDPDTIRIAVELDVDSRQVDELPAGFAGVYPLCNQKGQTEFLMGYGRSLSSLEVSSRVTNVTQATDADEDRKLYIQKESLKDGYSVGDEIAASIGTETWGEYELIQNDFVEETFSDMGAGVKKPKMIIPILKAIADGGFVDPSVGIHPSMILCDAATGTSFNGANNSSVAAPIDPVKLRKFSLRFSLSEGTTLPGNLCRVLIQFQSPQYGGFRPRIDYTSCTVTTIDGEVFRPFVNPPDSEENKIQDAKALMLSSVVKRPKDFKITFYLDTLAAWTDVTYKGAYWTVPAIGGDIIGYASSGGNPSPVTASSAKVYFVYHDLIREEDAQDMKDTNQTIIEKVVASLKAELT